MKLKEMHYQWERADEILAVGIYHGHLYIVRDIGWHPCAYVAVMASKPFDIDEIDCHGGITWCENHLPMSGNPSKPELQWIGWDYGHCNDYSGIEGDFIGGKRWTTDEIEQECMNVIDQLDPILCDYQAYKNKKGGHLKWRSL